MNRRQFNGSLLQTNNLSTIVPHRDCQFRRSRRSARSMSYEDALLRATQKPPHSDSNWKAIRLSSGMRPRDVRQGTATNLTIQASQLNEAWGHQLALPGNAAEMVGAWGLEPQTSTVSTILSEVIH